MISNLNEHYSTLDQKYYLPTFKRFPIALDHGKGSFVWDVNGKKYLDALAGIAVNGVGHCHPKVVKAIKDQAEKLIHVSNFFVSRPQVDLSQKLVELSGLDHVFFTNSGAESLEGAFKVARKYAHSIGRGGTILSFHNSFHGRTMATIATGKKKYQQGFDPIPGGFIQARFNDLEDVKRHLNDELAAIVIEPIQGEGGINVADQAFLRALRTLCDEHNIVLIFDEVQCGVGRTGQWFAKDYFQVEPDIMTLAKGLGGGVPIGAFLSNATVSKAIDFGDHGTTFGGNPLVCAASLAVLQVIDEEKLLDQVRDNGQWLRQRLEDLGSHHIRQIRGAGLMIGVELDMEAKPLIMDMLEEGVIANATADNVLRLVPPLNISRKELETLVSAIGCSLKKITDNE